MRGCAVVDEFQGDAVEFCLTREGEGVFQFEGSLAADGAGG